MRNGHRRRALVIELLILVLVAVLGYWQFATLHHHDVQARKALLEQANLNAAHRALSALSDQRRALLEGRVQLFSQEVEEFNKALHTVHLPPGDKRLAMVQQILEQHREFSSQAATTMSNQPPNRHSLLRLDQQAEHIAGLLEKFRSANSALSGFGLRHQELTRSTVITFTLITLLLMVGSFVLLNRLSRQSIAVASMTAAEQVRKDFVSFVSHELRNSMTALQQGISLLSNKNLTPQTRDEILHHFNQCIGGLSQLVQNLLNSDRAGRGQLEPVLQRVRVDEVVTDVSNRLSSISANLRDRLQLNIQENITVVADFDYLSLVLSNLIDNARKFSPDDAPIELTVASVSDRIQFSVRDHGPGIPPEKLDSIFELYESDPQPKNSSVKRGTGVGLYLCKKLVDVQGGELTVQSDLGEGTVFTFDLPGIH